MISEYVQCPICGKSFKQFSSQHLRLHGIQSIDEFKKLFPGYQYISEATRLKAGSNGKNAPEKRAITCDAIKDQNTINREKQYEEDKIEYDLNPRHCLECDKIIPYEKIAIWEPQKFCDSSCFATYQNRKNHPLETRKIKISKPAKVPKPVCYCSVCGKKINGNTTGMCKGCYVKSDKAMEQRGRTFSKHRKYITDMRTNVKFYIMSELEETFLNTCILNDIKIDKPDAISYVDKDNKAHIYFPDFYLPDYDLIIEIKGFLTKEDEIKYELVNQQNSLNWKILFRNDIEPFFKSIRGE